jgi:RimJ/RimL family protein N-acetyltransferase
LFAFSEAWRDELDVLLSHRGAKRIRRKTFSFNPQAFQAHAGWRRRLPAGVRVRLIDEQIAAENAEYRPLVDAGTKRFGVCVVVGDEIASVCSAVAVGGGEAEIGIHTEEKYRGHGHAFAAACAFVEESLSRGLTPNWSCWPEREASSALARKLGFEHKSDVPAHFWMSGL